MELKRFLLFLVSKSSASGVPITPITGTNTSLLCSWILFTLRADISLSLHVHTLTLGVSKREEEEEEKEEWRRRKKEGRAGNDPPPPSFLLLSSSAFFCLESVEEG